MQQKIAKIRRYTMPGSIFKCQDIQHTVSAYKVLNIGLKVYSAVSLSLFLVRIDAVISTKMSE